VVPKLEAMTGDTLSVTGKVEAAAFRFPNSLYRIAIEPDKRGTEGKLYAFLEKAADADPTLKVERDEDTGQTVISAIGEAQVSVLLDRLEDRAGVTAHTVKLCGFRIARPSAASRLPRVVTRSRPAAPASSATAGCASSPTPATATSSWTRSWAATSRANFIPAIDKGVQETMREGVLAGYPMIDVKVAVYDGSYHPVDSNEMAFKTAARIGFQKAVEQAEPVLLEPMAHLKHHGARQLRRLHHGRRLRLARPRRGHVRRTGRPAARPPSRRRSRMPRSRTTHAPALALARHGRVRDGALGLRAGAA
jgi:elongation factor G